ncbi:inositol monophosphatase family protein [Cohnella sp. GCM10020058]|uniref:inositol monophosphatase family protein n=1 Tax=Cohnella sp. GCM10020058 TaxID=3317330 RepID=UPI003639D894
MNENIDCRDAVLASAIRYAQDAGDQIVKRMSDAYGISGKLNLSDLVTDVDLQSEGLIRGWIARDYPAHWLLSEESDGAGDPFALMRQPPPGYGWIVDPIDGTINFVQGIPHFAISIGIMENGELLHGVVYNPLTRELYQATAGKGASLNGKRLQTSEQDDIGRAVLATGFQAADWRPESVTLARMGRVVGISRNVRIHGAASLDLCWVASGRLTGFWHDGLYPWDVAAGVLLVREAGGAVTNAEGHPYKLHNVRLVASNPGLQAALLALVGPER